MAMFIGLRSVDVFSSLLKVNVTLSMGRRYPVAVQFTWRVKALIQGKGITNYIDCVLFCLFGEETK